MWAVVASVMMDTLMQTTLMQSVQFHRLAITALTALDMVRQKMQTKPMVATVIALMDFQVQIAPHLLLAMPTLTAMDAASQKMQTKPMVASVTVCLGTRVLTVHFPSHVMRLHIVMLMV